MPTENINDEYFLNNFNTELTPEAEKRFQLWAQEVSQGLGKDILMDLYDYDLRGYFLDMAERDEGGHGPDTYKKPNHPTFSNESKYHGSKNPLGGKWLGGKWGENTFKPSREMLKLTHTPQMLEEYFKKEEPGIKLILDWKKSNAN